MSNKTKHYLGKIEERNGEMEYTDRFLFTTKGNPDKYAHKVASTWRGYKEKFDKDHGGYWYDGTLIFVAGCREVPKEDFDVLSKYIAVL
jgi:hypothetical protein